MRMRKKKNLSDRIAAVGDYFRAPVRGDKDFRAAEEQPEYIDFSDWFGSDLPILLEIGCGKGKFAVELALKNPQYNIIAVEKFANVVISGCEEAKRLNIKNLRFLNCAAEYLGCYLKPGSVSRIFLNFSCPFPKKRYACHRLTHHRFLNIYKRLLNESGEIHQKTDSRQLFEFSVEQLSGFGFKLKNISLDLHNSNFEDNIETEYEQRFSEQGLPIFRLEAFIK